MSCKFKAGDKVRIKKSWNIINTHVFSHDVVYIVESVICDTIKHKGIEKYYDSKHYDLVEEISPVQEKSGWGLE